MEYPKNSLQPALTHLVNVAMAHTETFDEPNNDDSKIVQVDNTATRCPRFRSELANHTADHSDHWAIESHDIFFHQILIYRASAFKRFPPNIHLRILFCLLVHTIRLITSLLNDFDSTEANIYFIIYLAPFILKHLSCSDDKCMT